MPSMPTAQPTTLHFLRQQVDKPVERPNFCLADFVAPQDSGKRDWIGAFAVTAGIGIDAHVARFEADHDDYNAILLKALADRLAEALAERLHQRVRTRALGLCRRRVAGQRRADRREVPRHPPRARLSGLPGAQRESHAVPAARCRRERGHAADRELRDAADRGGVAATTSPSRQPVFRGRPRVEGTGRGLRAAQGLSPCSRPSAGWPRTWTTTRNDGRRGPVGRAAGGRHRRQPGRIRALAGAVPARAHGRAGDRPRPGR